MNVNKKHMFTQGSYRFHCLSGRRWNASLRKFAIPAIGTSSDGISSWFLRIPHTLRIR